MPALTYAICGEKSFDARPPDMLYSERTPEKPGRPLLPEGGGLAGGLYMGSAVFYLVLQPGRKRFR